jgi:hypothetical protein
VRQVVKRALWVGVVQLLLFELVMRLSVKWRESTGELCLAILGLGMLLACIWALRPAFPRVGTLFVRASLRVAAALALFLTFYSGDYYYSWHLRPNLGLYEEPDWVAQHPAFQRELRERIQTSTGIAD